MKCCHADTDLDWSPIARQCAGDPGSAAHHYVLRGIRDDTTVGLPMAEPGVPSAGHVCVIPCALQHDMLPCRPGAWKVQCPGILERDPGPAAHHYVQRRIRNDTTVVCRWRNLVPRPQAMCVSSRAHCSTICCHAELGPGRCNAPESSREIPDQQRITTCCAASGMTPRLVCRWRNLVPRPQAMYASSRAHCSMKCCYADTGSQRTAPGMPNMKRSPICGAALRAAPRTG